MKRFFCSSFIVLVFFVATNADAHFTGKGHIHTLSETKELFSNPRCRLTDTCDLKRFMLTTSAYEVWFSDDPNYPTYGNGVIMEYETDSVDEIEKYAIVQFKKGCVFYSSKNSAGQIRRNVGDTTPSFGENIPSCFPEWIIDSQDGDPAYNSDPQYGRFHFLRWNKPGSHDERTQKYYGVEKPKLPVVYMADYPAGAFVSESAVRNVALEFNTCIYKARDVPIRARRDYVHFAQPIACFPWQNIYVYDFDSGTFQTDLAYVPKWEQPYARVNVHVLIMFITIFIALALLGFSRSSSPLSPQRFRQRKRFEKIDPYSFLL